MLFSRRLQSLSPFFAMIFSIASVAQTVSIPAGTTVYGELDETVTSKKRDTSVGDIVRAHVWRDVVVNNQIVFKAGAPMVLRVSSVKNAKVAGRKGDLELEAVSARAIDGTDVLLDGGYDKSGKGRMAAAIVLFAIVSWPLIFIKGKQAVLDAGTVFDCSIQSDASIQLAEAAPVRINLRSQSPLSVDVLYDNVDADDRNNALPIMLRSCGIEFSSASVVTVNGAHIDAETVKLGESSADDDCTTTPGTIDLKSLGKHFRKGINRFEIAAGNAITEVVLEVEL